MSKSVDPAAPRCPLTTAQLPWAGLRVLCVAALAWIAACSSGGGGQAPVSTGQTSVESDATGGQVANGTDVVTLSVTVRDAQGQPLAGRSVVFLVSGSGNSLLQPSSLTGADGVALGTLSSSVAETKLVTVIIDAGPNETRMTDALSVLFVGDPLAISPTNSLIVADRTAGVLANGVEQVLLTVSVRDGNDNPVPGQLVELASSGSGDNLTQPLGTTDAAGIASGTLDSTVAELKTLTARVNPGSGEVALAAGVEVEFVGDPATIDATLSTALASPAAGVTADGTTTSALTVTVRDANGNAVAGQLVSLSASGSANTLVQPPLASDTLGQATGTLASTLAEIKLVTVTVNSGPNEVVLTQTPTVEFLGDPGDVSAVLSSVVATPTSDLIADGTTLSSVTITVRDGNGNPVPGQVVQLASSGSGNTITQPAAPTDAAGVVLATIASTRAESKTLTATVDPAGSPTVLATQPGVSFIGDPSTIDAALSQLSANPSGSLVADGSSASTLTVVVRDVNGNPVAGQSVQLAASGSGNTLTQPAAVTDATGTASGSLASTTAESKLVTATVNPGAGQVVVAQTASVGFISNSAALSPTLSSAIASPALGVVADGSDSSALTVTVRDVNGNTVAGQLVQFSASGSGNTITQPIAVTDAAGIASGSIRSTAAEFKTVTVTLNPGAGQVVLASQPSVEFIADAANISSILSSALASPGSGVVADGVVVSAITVTLRDVNGNPIPGLAVQLASTGVDNTLVQPTAVTDAAGQTSGSLASITAETKVISVTADPGGASVQLLQTPTIEFIGDPANISPTQSFASATPSSGLHANDVESSTLSVVVRDVNGNPVRGQTVFLASDGSNNTLAQPASTTDSNGSAGGTLSSTTAEIKTITVTVNPGPTPVELTQKPTVEFIADTTVSPSLSSVLAAPQTNVVADGADLSTLTVTVRDGQNNAVSGATVWISSSGSANTITQPVGTTDLAGQATGTIASTLAELKTLTVTIDPGPGQVVLDDQPGVDFIADAGNINATLSTAVASPSTGLAADGVASSTITITVLDDNGNPVPNQAVSLADTGSGNALGQPATTDAAGTTSGTLATTVAELKTLTVTVNPGPGQVVLVAQPTVEFLPAAIDAALSSVVCVPSTNVTADGTSLSTITVIVLDAQSNPVPGQTVLLAASGTNNTLTQPVAVTDAAGVATGTLASITAETKTVTATVNPGAGQVVLADLPTVEFVADPSTIHATLSTAGTSPASGVVADGSASSTLTITVRDANGNPVPGQSVSLAATGSNHTLTQPAAPSDAAGQVTGSISSTLAELKTLTATINPGPGQVVLTQQPTVEFIADVSTISASLSSSGAAPSTGVIADDVDSSSLTITVLDANANPVPGQTVQVASSGSGNTLTQPAGFTDAAGQATAALTSTVAETKTLVFTVNPGAGQVVVTQQPTVEFIADVSTISASLSGVGAAPTSDVTADDVDSSTITISVVDAFGNPVPDQVVALAATGSGNTLTQPAAVTDAAGQATGSLTSTVAEDKTLGATVNPGAAQVVLTQAPVVTFIPDVGAISATLSSAGALPSTGVIADGSSLSTLTVTVLDVNGNAVPGQTVQLATTGSGNTLGQPAGVTDGAGQVTATLASTSAEIKVVTITVNPGPNSVDLVQTPSIEFIGDATNLSAALSFTFAAPSMGVAADGVSTSDVYAYVRDVNDNPVPGVTLELAATGTGNSLTQPAAVTDAGGLASASIASTNAEVKTLTITADPSGVALAFDGQPTVEFIADASDISAGNSSALASPASDVVADGITTSTVTVTVRDGNNNPLAGQTVQLSASGSGNTITQPAAVTDANGVASGLIATTVAETKTLTATVDPGGSAVVVTQQPTVAFIGDAGNLSAGLSSVAVDTPAGLAADGVATASIAITVLDALGNPVPGRTVQLAVSGSGNVLTQPPSPTNASGVATAVLTSTAAELKTISAIVDPGGSALALDDRPTVEFAWVLQNTYYVRTTGTDPGGCTGGTSPATAWATLAQAAACVGAGDTVYVGAGTYLGGITLTSSGTSASPIRFIADTDGIYTGDAGAVILDGAGANQTVHLNGAAWNELVGFTVIGASGSGAPQGGILVAGADAVIRENTVYGNITGIYVDGVNDVLIESNKISNNAGAASDGIVVAGGNNAVVRGNLVYNCGRHGLSVESGSDGLLAENNTLYSNAVDGVHIDTPGNALVSRNNLVTDNGDDGVELVSGSALTSSYNDVFGNADLDLVGYSTGTGDLSVDPLYVDPDGGDNQLGGAQGGDDRFQLDENAASPAIDAGAADAATIALDGGGTLADRTTRGDEVLDGSGADGATVNLGYHYGVASPGLAPLAAGDARFASGSGSSRRLRLRDWDLSLGSWSAELSAPPTGATLRWVTSAISPLDNGEELTALLADDGSNTSLQLLRWSGSDWISDWTSTAIASSDAARRGFDLVYEATSGDALAVYSDGSDTPVYRTLVNGDWSAESALPLNDGGGPNPDTNSGTVTWIELVSRPATDEVALVYADAKDDLVVLVWDGGQWLTAGAATLETGLKTNPLSGEVDNRVFDAAFEASSGDLMVAWGRQASVGFWWSLQASGSSSWSSAAQVASAPGGGVPHHVDLAAEPSGTRIAAALFVLGDTTERLGLATWNGGAWGDAVELDSQIRDTNDTATGDFPGAVGWVGTSGRAVCVYADNQSGTLDWASWSSSVGWELRSDVPIAGKAESESVQVLSYASRDLLLVWLSDSNGDVYAATFDGIDWTVTNSASPIATGLSGLDTRPFSGALR